MTGPDGKEKKVRLTIVSSSASTNLDRNRGELATLQANQSKHAREVFEDGLRNSDMTIYVGHGRDGAGPSFEPPVLRRNTLPGATRPGHTPDGREAPNFDWYKRHHESRDSMMAALASGPNPPKMLGMFACHTEKYFADRALKASERNGVRKTGFVGSQGYTALEAMYAQSMMMLDSTLALRCQGDFERAIHAVGSVQADPTSPPVNQLPPISRGVWDRALPAATIAPRPVSVPAPVPASEPQPVVEEEVIPTVETVRPPVLLPQNQTGGRLDTPIRPSGTVTPPATAPDDSVR